MKTATLRLQPRRTSLVQKLQTESCSHAVDLGRYETRLEAPFLLLSFDAEFAAFVLLDVIAGGPQVLNPKVS